ncbi:hypothetical protein [Paenibacillus luteus]|uniref:hypothetical protein n=1 Tax=Paenibacillus luteus TaxID=2545753 RepID=UPI0019D602FF|nr:hypothetical protein [Paenibacillus luteus]
MKATAIHAAVHLQAGAANKWQRNCASLSLFHLFALLDCTRLHKRKLPQIKKIFNNQQTLVGTFEQINELQR